MNLTASVPYSMWLSLLVDLDCSYFLADKVLSFHEKFLSLTTYSTDFCFCKFQSSATVGFSDE